MKVTPKQYAKLLFKVGQSQESDQEKETQIAKIANFLLRNRDRKKLKKIEFEFDKMLVSEGKKLSLIIESAHALSADQVEDVRKQIATERGISAEVIDIEQKVDEKLLGGLKVTIGNEIVDSSLAAKIGMLKKTLTI
jgi:F-type H+-transporting ATPase subunit delta